MNLSPSSSAKGKSGQNPMSKKFEEWELIGELGEKLLATASKFQELKLALVHREVQRMADDNEIMISWTAEKLDKFRIAWKAHDKEEAESFVFEGNEYRVDYGRYLIEYLEYVLGEAA